MINLEELKRLAMAVLTDGKTVSNPDIDDAFQEAANPAVILELIERLERAECKELPVFPIHELTAIEDLFSGAALGGSDDMKTVHLFSHSGGRQINPLGGAARDFKKGEILRWSKFESTEDILHSWNVARVQN